MEVLVVLLVLGTPLCAIVALVVAAVSRRRLIEAEARWLQRHRALQRQLDRLEGRAPAMEQEPATLPLETEPEPEPEPEADHEPAPEPVRAAAAPAAPAPPQPAAAAPRLSLEERIGGRWFNWVGILAILFGVAYAMKYSFDQGWVTPRMRFWSGLGFGIVLLGAGLFSERHRYAVLARGFWGGGIGVLFLVFFAGFKLLLDPDGAPIVVRGVAFAGMAATVVVGVCIAVVYDTRTTAVLSAVGGYLTPVLLATGEPDQVFLFTYLSILTGGLLVLGYVKRWAFVRPLTFGVVVSYFAGWWATQGMGAPWAMLLYVSVMFVFFSAETVAWSAFRRVADADWSYLLMGLNTTLHVLVGLTVLDRFWPAYQGLFLLASASLHFGGALLVKRRHPADHVLVFFLAQLAAVLFLLAPVFEERTTEHWLPMTWAVQGAALFLAAERWGGGGLTRGWGFAALALSALRLLAVDTPKTLATVEPYLPFWNDRALAFCVVIAVFAFACWRMHRRQRTGVAYHATTGLWVVALSLPAVLFSLELAQGLDTYVAPRFEAGQTGAFKHSSAHWMTLLWAAYATLVATVTGRRGAPVLRFVAFMFGAVVLVKYVVKDLVVTYETQATVLTNSRMLVTAAMAACLFWCAREFRFLQGSARVAAHVLMLGGLCMEWVDFCHDRAIDAGFWLDAPLMGMSLLIAGYGTALMVRGPPLLVRAGVVLAAAAAAKWLLLDIPLAQGPAAALLFQLRFVAAAGVAAACFLAAGRGVAGRFATGLRVVAHLVVVVALSFEVLDLFARHGWDRASPLSVVIGGYLAVTAFWALYGLGALLAGHKWQRPHLRGLGLALVSGSLVVGLALLPEATRAGKLVWNTRFLGLAATATGLLWAAGLYRRKDLRLEKPLEIGGSLEGAALGGPLTLAGHGLVMLLLTLEASDYFFRSGARAVAGDWIDADSARQLSYSLIWAVYAVGLVVAGLLRKYRLVRLMALAVLVFTIVKVFVFDLSFLENPYRMLSFLVLGGILVGVSYLYQKYKAYLV